MPTTIAPTSCAGGFCRCKETPSRPCLTCLKPPRFSLSRAKPTPSWRRRIGSSDNHWRPLGKMRRRNVYAHSIPSTRANITIVVILSLDRTLHHLHPKAPTPRGSPLESIPACSVFQGSPSSQEKEIVERCTKVPG